MKVHVKVPATAANLGAGLDCLGVAIDLWNELIVEEASDEEICIRGEGEEDLPRDSQNLTVTSFKLLISKLIGVDPESLPKFQFFCVNNIPLARGLGSSTAAIVAGLLAAAALGPHLHSRKNDALPGPKISTEHPCNWAAVSASADVAADSTVLKPVAFPTQGGSRTLAILGKEATRSCLQDSRNKHLGSGDFLCGTHSLPSVSKQHSSNCESRADSDIPVSKAIEGNLSLLKRTAAGETDIACLSVLLQIAGEMEGHADNAAPAIYGGLRLTLAGQFPGDEQTRDGTEEKHIGRHEKKWIAREIPVPPSLKLVFFIPADRLLTKTAREALPREVRLEDAVYNVARSALFVHCLTASAAASAAVAATCCTCCHSADESTAPNSKQRCLAAAVGIPRSSHAFAAGDESSAAEVAAAKAAEGVLFPLLQEAMNDKLHQPYRRALNPHLEPLIASAHQAGALGTALSGAGPSVVAFCMARRADEVASAMKKAAEQIKKKGRVLVTEPSAEGAHIGDLVVDAGKEIR